MLSIAMRDMRDKALKRLSDIVVGRRIFVFAFPPQHRKRHLTAAVSNQHAAIEISGPKVVENVRCIGRSAPLSGPGP